MTWKILPFYKKTIGLYTEVDHARHEYDPSSGVLALSSCKNVDIDDQGRISRRSGFEVTDITTSCHSLFRDAGECLFVTGDALCVLHSDLATYSPLRNVAVGRWMSYLEFDGRIYYSNGVEFGYVENGASYAWGKPTYTGHTTSKVYADPLAGHIIEFHSGRVYVGWDKYLMYSRRYSFSEFHKHDNRFTFDSRLRLVAPVADGVFVSSSTSIWFLQFNDPSQVESMRETRLTNYPAIEGTLVKTFAGVIGQAEMPIVVFATNQGICVGSQGGVLENITRHKINFPPATMGAAVLKDRRYVCNIWR